jgi:hypothetical protein
MLLESAAISEARPPVAMTLGEDWTSSFILTEAFGVVSIEALAEGIHDMLDHARE